MVTAASGVSVLMPVYNGQRFVSESIESILSQTYKNLELVIVDDGSTDGTTSIVREFEQRDSRVRVLLRPHQGIVSALNTGLHSCQSPLVARMDSDDVACPTRLAVQKRYLDDHADCVAIGSQVLHIDASGDRLPVETVPLQHAEIVHRMLHRSCAMWHPSVTYRRDVVRTIGGYRPECEWAEDLDLWLRLSEVGRLVNLDLPLLKYRIHSEKVCSVKRREQRVLDRTIVHEFCESRGLPIPRRCRPSWSQLLRGNAWDAIGTRQPIAATVSGILAVCCNPLHSMNYRVTALALRDVCRTAVSGRPDSGGIREFTRTTVDRIQD